MLIEIFDRVNQRVRNKTITVARMKCDACGREFTRDLSRFDVNKKHSCSNSCRRMGMLLTDEQKAKISQKLSGVKKSAETRKKMSINNACRRSDIRQKLSQLRSAGIAEGRIQPFYSGNHGTYVSTKTGKSEKYHSWLERDRMRILDVDPNVEFWTKSHGVVIPYEINEKFRNYVPDFLIRTKSKTIIEELKGWTGEETLPAKLAALRVFCDENHYDMSYVKTQDVKIMLESFDLIPSSRELVKA